MDSSPGLMRLLPRDEQEQEEVVVMTADKYYIALHNAQYQHSYEANRHKKELSSSYDCLLDEILVAVPTKVHILVVVF